MASIYLLWNKNVALGADGVLNLLVQSDSDYADSYSNDETSETLYNESESNV